MPHWVLGLATAVAVALPFALLNMLWLSADPGDNRALRYLLMTNALKLFTWGLVLLALSRVGPGALAAAGAVFLGQILITLGLFFAKRRNRLGVEDPATGDADGGNDA